MPREVSHVQSKHDRPALLWLSSAVIILVNIIFSHCSKILAAHLPKRRWAKFPSCLKAYFTIWQCSIVGGKRGIYYQKITCWVWCYHLLAVDLGKPLAFPSLSLAVSENKNSCLDWSTGQFSGLPSKKKYCKNALEISVWSVPIVQVIMYFGALLS